jgi:hypothetical protein
MVSDESEIEEHGNGRAIETTADSDDNSQGGSDSSGSGVGACKRH